MNKKEIKLVKDYKLNKREIKLVKEYIDRDLEEYFIYEIDEPYRVALTKLSKELGNRLK